LNVFLSRQQCPTCKAPIHEELLIPLYTRGFRPGQPAAARGASWGGAERVPVRPQGLRIANDDPRLANNLALPDLDLVGERLSGWGSHFVLGDLDPSHARISRAYDPFSMSLEQQQHVFLSRLLLLLGSFVILCLLIF
jgi:E3 ubiquitin-protein ligase RNF5